MRRAEGSVLVAALAACMVLVTMCVGLVSRTAHDARVVAIDRSYYRALYAAETGAGIVRNDLTSVFSDIFAASDGLTSAFSWLDGLVAATEDPPYDRSALSGAVGEASYAVAITKVENPSYPLEAGTRYITLRSVGSASGMSKVVEVTFRLSLDQSRVFDYVYFVNNTGLLHGDDVTVNGDMWANGDFAFIWNPKTNGDVYAAANPEAGAAGMIYGGTVHDSLEEYRGDADDRSRPTNPTAETEDANGNGRLDPGEDRNGNGLLDTFEYPWGYDGHSERFPCQQAVEMPQLGDLSLYRAMALSSGGQIVQDGDVLVDGVYDGAGPDGHEGTADDGCLLLVGTDDHPIEITGPVVIEKDLVIRGVVKGQGAIYTGRNILIAGDITYDDPPSWPKPDEDPAQTASDNAGKDMLGLLAKGNIVIGDYTRGDWMYACGQYLRPPFTHGYEVDETDAQLGYDSDGYAGNGYWFDGNYLAWDGGFKNRDRNGHHQAPRAYYETSLSDDTVHDVADQEVHEIAAVLFTDHACAGLVDDFKLYGALAVRDEAVVYDDSMEFIYDVRARSSVPGHVDAYLARDVADSKVLVWREVRQ